jgi:type II secretory pathway pseudopilin PulG
LRIRRFRRKRLNYGHLIFSGAAKPRRGFVEIIVLSLFWNEAATSPHRHHSPFFSGRWIMSTHLETRGFTLVELVVVLIVLVFVIALILPAISVERGPSNRNTCLNKLRQIGLALENYESGHREYPLASWNKAPTFNALASTPAGRSGAAVTGYSWIVAILPQFEEKSLYDAIVANSSKFTTADGPFDPAVVNGSQAWQHASCVSLPAVICPQWAGDGYNNSNLTVDIGPSGGAPAGYGAIEYANVDSKWPGAGDRPFKGKVAPTNYKPMIGTHMRGGVPVENGGMLLTGSHGPTHADFKDGISKTIFVCETKESSYASWYDGTLNWLVGNDPNQPPPGTNDKAPWAGGAPAINRGFDPAKPGSVPYLKKSLTSNAPQNDVWWGPSSDHANGCVCHVFVDNHTICITDQCDPETYLSLITRADGEMIDDTKIH